MTQLHKRWVRAWFKEYDTYGKSHKVYQSRKDSNHTVNGLNEEPRVAHFLCPVLVHAGLSINEESWRTMLSVWHRDL